MDPATLPSRPVAPGPAPRSRFAPYRAIYAPDPLILAGLGLRLESYLAVLVAAIPPAGVTLFLSALERTLNSQ